MRRNVQRNVTGNHKTIIIIVLSVVVVVAIVAAVVFNMTHKSGNNQQTNDTSSAAQTSDQTNASDAGAQTESGITVGTDEDPTAVKTAIETLVGQYRQAFADADIEKLKMIYNTDQVMDAETITAAAQIITGYENTKCYIKDGMDASSRVVFIYDDLKINGIETLVPNIAYVYVRRSDDGTWYIDPGTYDTASADYVYSSEIQKYISELIKEKDISKLYTTVSEKFNKLCEEDPQVKAFMDKLNAADAGQSQSEAQTGAGESVQTDESAQPAESETKQTEETSQTDESLSSN